MHLKYASVFTESSLVNEVESENIKYSAIERVNFNTIT